MALLTARCFARPQPLKRQIWRIRLSTSGVQALCDFPNRRIGFATEDFSADPRVAV
ncbi:hypothetical protein SF83666_b53050 (plasmid) [Sinorhizobium fredii CCBAU 83666]|nr:hypothetical protein SF83666_b53050 [Sinorhizobium fredii CCBAU 83666]